MSIERFSFPTTIHFGAGARKLVADHLKAQGIARPLLVTDRGIAALPLLGALARRPARPRRRRLLGHLRQSGAQPGDGRRRRVQGAPRRRRHRRGRRRGARRRQGHRADGRTTTATSSNTRGTIRRCAPIDAADSVVRRAADDRRHRLGGRALVGGLRRRHARQEDHLLAAAARQGGVRRSRTDARPAAVDHRGDRHGRADAQRRVVPVAGLPSAVRRHRARRRAHRRARAAASP